MLTLFFFAWYVVTTSRERGQLLNRIMARDLPDYTRTTQIEQAGNPAPRRKEPEQPPRRRNPATVTVEPDIDIVEAQSAFNSIIGE